MNRQQAPLKSTAVQFLRTVGIFMNSEVGRKAKLMFAVLFALLSGVSGLNVANSYVGRNFMSAIAERQTAEFIRQAVIYIGVFAASTVVAVLARFTEERLALVWREFLTRRAVGLYLTGGAFYRLDISGELSHPDQRIADDIRVFTVTTLSFVIMALNSSLTVVTFSGVLWAISPLLFIVAVLYAACGTYLTIGLGRPLINLNYNQLDREASFRASLIRAREFAEPIIVARGEERMRALLLQRLDDLVGNFRRITAINRNVGFFTTGYNWLIQILPVLIIAPAFIRGDIEFGVITQSAAAFAMLVGAFSLIVTQFNQISTFAAVVARLSSLQEAIEKARATPFGAIETIETNGRLAYERLTLLALGTGTPLLKDLSVSIPAGRPILVTGSDEGPGMALFRATAGIPIDGSGRILRPGPGEIQFVPQWPYLPSGTLREILSPPENTSAVSEAQISRLLDGLGIQHVMSDADGLDTVQDWTTSLSMREQQLLALVRALLAAPRYVLLEKIEVVLGPEQLDHIVRGLADKSITFINFGKANGSWGFYEAVLEYGQDGTWMWTKN